MFSTIILVVFSVLIFSLPLPEKWHVIKDYWLGTMGVCSVLHTFLPPWDWDPDFVKTGLSEFPKLQNIFRKTFNNRYYRLLIYSVGYLAINARSTIWAGSISIKNQIAQAVQQAHDGK